ncbi:uncharacterized protein LOC123683197 isoform X1 [Harmonia axyridis]|uniref:uncharacterized protein LOC123683197 isoform X1 n=1 Tax=Harmonia axyridis TaxID=115357 RepID=UPI001E277998|nr:uncharacterized protein LOC123683197 isoform X1 [Harmonia axyridis]
MVVTTHKTAIFQVETFLVIIAGMTALILDSSFITFSKDVDKIWKIALDPYKFPPIMQMHLKYALTTLVVVRTFTVHITIALYVVMLWPAIFADREYLLIPWIVVGTIRLCCDIVATVIGLFICSKYGLLSTLWIEFLIVQLLKHGPAFYVWLTIVRYRSYLLDVEEERRKQMEQEIYLIRTGRKSRRQMTVEQRRSIQCKRDSISQATIATIIHRLSHRDKENMSTRSLDTLLEIIDRGHREEEESSWMSEDSSYTYTTYSTIQSEQKQFLPVKIESEQKTIQQLIEESEQDTNTKPNDLVNKIDMGSVKSEVIEEENNLQCIYDESTLGTLSPSSSEREMGFTSTKNGEKEES